MLPYVTAVLLTAVGLLGLWKDWRAHHRYARWVLGVILLVLLAANLVQLRSTRREAQTNVQQIKNLETAVQATRTENDNAKHTFVQLFGTLNSHILNLQTKVRTEELQSQLSATAKQLAAAQEALAPGPKARLQFGGYVSPESDLLPRKVFLRRQGAVVPVEISVRNGTDTSAVEGTVYLRICDDCEYATEPAGFAHAPGALASDRAHVFSVIAGKSRLNFRVDVIPPFDDAPFTIGFRYACKTCVDDPDFQDLLVSLRK